MDSRHLADVLSQAGFEVKVLGGYHTDTSPAVVGSKIHFQRMLRNRLISVLGPAGLRLAPFFCLYARRSEARSDRG